MRKQFLQISLVAAGLILCLSFLSACDKEVVELDVQAPPAQQDKIIYKLEEEKEADLAEWDDENEQINKVSTLVYSHLKQEGKEFVEIAEFSNEPNQPITFEMRLPQEAKQAFSEPRISVLERKLKTTVYEVSFSANEDFFKDKLNTEVFYELKWKQLIGDTTHTITRFESSIETAELFR
ncbi:hypothetical protein [Paenibacillus sp. J45TS6]|uniref:hypothetical protein n=1 Tax=Paenibacillus sp. J45TS6 TaxID=2807196 RepID=UPI001BCAD119|nr:hypothetical protein [Paenibacillus sp. J45TS6]